MSQAEELLTKLNDATFRQEVERWARETLSMADCFVNGDVDGSTDLEGDWDGSLEMAMNMTSSPDTIFDRIVAELTQPRVITLHDLVEGISLYLDARDQRLWNEFDELYASFLDHIRFHTLGRPSRTFDVCTVGGFVSEGDRRHYRFCVDVGRALGKAELLGQAPEMPLPSEPSKTEDDVTEPISVLLGNGVSLAFSGIRRDGKLRTLSEAGFTYKDTLEATISGEMSEAALNGLLEEGIEPVLRAVITTVRALRPPKESEPGGSSLRSSVNLSELRDNVAFIRDSVLTLFAPSGKKDTIPRRIGNAVRLIALADGQTSAAVKLALNVTAIEALLGTDGAGDISKALAECVTVLLEPTPAERHRAFKFVKDLYNRRSRTLHGDDVTGDEASAYNARTLSAACTYGVWFRYDFLKRLGHLPDTPDALLKTLMEKKWDGTRPDAVPDLPAVRRLWATSPLPSSGS